MSKVKIISKKIYVNLRSVNFPATVINKRCHFPKEMRNDLIKQFERGKLPGWILFPKLDTDTEIEYVRNVPSK
jgi:hypothetical protein